MEPEQKLSSAGSRKKHRHRKHSDSRKKRKIKKRNKILLLLGIAATIVVLTVWLSQKSHIQNSNEHHEIITDQPEED